MDSNPSIPIVAACLAALAIAFWDAKLFRIPNVVTFPLLLGGVAYHFWADGWPGLVFSVAGVVVGGTLLLGPYLLGGIGAGDVKLLAAMGAWLQTRLVLLIFGYSGLLLCAVAVYRLSRNEAWMRSMLLNFRIAKCQLLSLGRSLVAQDTVEEVRECEARNERLIPFGVCFAIGLCGWAILEFLKSRS
jgi:prepilin peptidase CpaA